MFDILNKTNDTELWINNSMHTNVKKILKFGVEGKLQREPTVDGEIAINFAKSWKRRDDTLVL